MEVPQKTNSRVAIRSSNPTPGHISGEREKKPTLIQKGTYTPMFVAALFTIAKTWKEVKRLSTGE